ncbi:uncharacterized protein LOC135192963 [Pogoniulus pusillus]|uniref:uncharacterized protein LOC135192963 n=1 Tax=Pogoniulus pusillus TaxID=488313 RepID=UPI0030B98097
MPTALSLPALTLKAMATVERLFCLLEAHGARPSVEGLDWARENWSNCQSVMDRIVALQKEARAKSGKGKAFICAVLGACLAASIDEKQSQNGRENKIISSLQELVDTLQGHIVTLKDEVADLKDRLKTEQKWQKWFLKEEELKQTEPASIYPQAELAAAEEAAAHMRPLIKTEMLYEDEDGTPAITTKEIPFSYTELAKLRKEFTRSAGESEVEYVWRVSKTGGDQIRLTEAEATGYWGANVFLTTGNRSGPWSLTQRAVFWAGGFDSKERGEPLVLRGGMNQIMENVQKAACLQMVYDRELKHHFESPLSLLVDSKRMTPLVRGLPDSLKMKGIQLQKEIADTPLTSRIQATLRENLTPGRNQPDADNGRGKGKGLGIKVYDNLGRKRRSISTQLAQGNGQKWGKDDWTPQRIIEYYGPATWNPHEWISGAREPIYNLNHIVRLQAVLEITNETARALDLLADQSTQMRTAIIQHRMVLDYLLAEEGGVCGKLNDSNCCLQIDDNGKVVRQISSGI